MITPAGREYPVPFHETWNVTDSSKVGTFLRCRRMYFYEYILGWRRAGVNNDLHFGHCIHYAMAHIMNNWHLILETNSLDPFVPDAYNKFLVKYRELIGPDEDLHNAPKCPGYVIESLVGYIEKFRSLDRGMRVLFTEVAGSVPIGVDEDGDSIVLYYRLDTVVEDPAINAVYILEHKTAKTFSPQWVSKWKMSHGLSTYVHILYCLYPPERVWGAKVNGLRFRKRDGPDYVRVPVRKSQAMMNAWLWEVRDAVLDIRHEFDRLSQCSPSDDRMESFSCTGAHETCVQYWGCPYLDFCAGWANPLARCQQVPQGYKVERWDPRDYEEDEGITVKHIGGLSEQGGEDSGGSLDKGEEGD